jgi:phosphoglycolate phosphatase
MKFKAVLFDLDGTLMDTLEDLGDAMNFILRQFKFPEHPLESYKYFVGEGIDVLVRKALPKDQTDETIFKRCAAAMKSEYAKRCTAKSHPYEGIPDLLDAFADMGMKMVILSNKPHDQTCYVVSCCLSQWQFETVLGSRPNVPKKPDPSEPIKIADQLNILPQEFLYLGDTSIDMQTAAAAGMYGTGVLWGFRPAEELIEGGARILVRTPADLLAWF